MSANILFKEKMVKIIQREGLFSILAEVGVEN